MADIMLTQSKEDLFMTEIIKKRLTVFLLLAFGISWLCALVIILTGGIQNSPEINPGSGITLALVLLSTVYMWGPALASLITRIITKEGWGDMLLMPNIKKSWPYWLTAWVAPALLSILGAVLFFLLLPGQYDHDLSLLREQLEAANMNDQLANPFAFIIQQTLVAIALAPLFNFGATFGEELGWRGYLLPKLSVLGKRKALLISSVIWGVWHWPIIWLGHNYGLNYWGFPWLGLLATIWFTVAIGVFFGWLAQKAGNIWPAVIGHAALNGIASIGMLFVANENFPTILGPSSAGLIGSLPFMLVSIYILLKVKD